MDIVWECISLHINSCSRTISITDLSSGDTYMADRWNWKNYAAVLGSEFTKKEFYPSALMHKLFSLSSWDFAYACIHCFKIAKKCFRCEEVLSYGIDEWVMCWGMRNPHCC